MFRSSRAGAWRGRGTCPAASAFVEVGVRDFAQQFVGAKVGVRGCAQELIAFAAELFEEAKRVELAVLVRELALPKNRTRIYETESQGNWTPSGCRFFLRC